MSVEEYIELYKRIFVFDEIEENPVKDSDKTLLNGDGEKEKQLDENPLDYNYIDLSKLNVPSIYANVFAQEGIQANGLNIGDGYSYVDFKKHKKTGVISFSRRNRDNTTLPMEYSPDNKKTTVIRNGKRHVLGAIVDELQSVLDQISKM